MDPITPFDRAEWHDVHPRADLPPQRTHCVTIARRIVLAGLLALGCVVVIGTVIAVVEIAGDWVSSGRATPS